jgi:hypothetical protein
MEKKMKAIKQVMLLTLCLIPFVAGAYTIGGAYASLVSCEWGQYGYQYGNIGTYNVNGKLYQVFFGSSYCEY